MNKYFVWYSFILSILIFVNAGCSTPQKAVLKTNTAQWHTVTVPAKTNIASINWYQRVNPIWWCGNMEEPLAPEWYQTNNPMRHIMWYFRNPFSNLCNYTIGVADKESYRSGKYPTNIGNPYGGWNFAVTRWRFLYFPFVDYKNSRMEFYFGWRERGNFGIKLNFHRIPEKIPKQPEVEITRY